MAQTTVQLNPETFGRLLAWPALFLLVLSSPSPVAAGAAESPGVARFRKEIQPILAQFCYDCHGDGMNKGKVAFDELKSERAILGSRDLWFAALKNRPPKSFRI